MICYLSKNYKGSNSGGNKAKIDIEKIMSQHGIQNIGLKQTQYTNSIIAYFLTLCSVIKGLFHLKKGDTIILQYPFKKYYDLICKIARWKGCKIITLIHDLGSFRRKRLTVAEEIKRLNRNNVIIVHSEAMKNWLIEQGIQSELEVLDIFDYLSGSSPLDNKEYKEPYRVVFTGNVSTKQNAFLYEEAEIAQSHELVLYGGGLEAEKMKGKYDYKGFVSSDKLIATVQGHFGLVWYGTSLDGGKGPLGEYLRYNAPHKMSLYIRCGLPIIIWKEAALAPFVKKHNIGICVDSLTELDNIFTHLSEEDYLQMKANTKKIADQLSKGFYTNKAISNSCIKSEKKQL